MPTTSTCESTISGSRAGCRGLLLALLSGSMAVRAIEGRWNISLADVLRFAAMVTLLPGIISRRPAVHATQMIVLMLILIVAPLRVADPIV